ncbi:aminotransferase class IV [Algoriphagus sp.]|uniref:aminotransferase class IV n=1 Tax=Algoriphagus sp. TaxID=1872435 RepID=UPI0026338B13|nr:aminotransferase class IV [Algoriphagus sp.]
MGKSNQWKSGSAFPIPNRAMAFGDGLFETMIFDGEKIRFFEFHVDRLRKGMKLLHLDLSQLNPDVILSFINSTEPQRIKWTVFRAGAGKYSPHTGQINQVLQIAPFKKKSEISLQAVISREVFLVPSMISQCKTLNSLPYVLAALEREKRGANEIILLDHKGNVSEAGASNIFWSIGEEIFTPSLQAGCIEGVSRKVILQELNDNGFKVKEGLFKVDQLRQADRVWISNATGITYLKSIEETVYSDDPVPLIENLF